MQNIIIKDFSKECASKKAGLKLKEKMEALLKTNEAFTINFEEINRFASPFFNNSFATLAIQYGFNKIKQIPIINLSEAGKLAYDTSIENAMQLMSNPDYSEKINNIINSNIPKKDE